MHVVDVHTLDHYQQVEVFIQLRCVRMKELGRIS